MLIWPTWRSERLSGRGRSDQASDAAAQHLHPGRDEGSTGSRCGLRPHRAGSPADRGDDDDRDARWAGATASRSDDERRDSGEPESESGDVEAGDAFATERRGEQCSPDRHRGDDDCGHARGNLLLGDGHQAVSAERQRKSDHCSRSPLLHAERVGLTILRWAVDGEREHQHAGDHEACPGQHKRRDRGAVARVNRDADCEVGRPPQQVDRPQGHPDPGVARLVAHVLTLRTATSEFCR